MATLNDVKEGSIVKPIGTPAGVWVYVLKKEEDTYSQIVLFDDNFKSAMKGYMPNKNEVFTNIVEKWNKKFFIKDVFEFDWQE